MVGGLHLVWMLRLHSELTVDRAFVPRCWPRCTCCTAAWDWPLNPHTWVRNSSHHAKHA